MKTSKYITGLLMAIMMSVVSSCFDDLDQYPHIEQTPKDIYTSVPNYRQVLAKLYGSYVLAGQDKGGGNTDISGSRGFDYMRCYFNLQEIGTDETAMLSYASDNQTGLTFLSWDSNDVWVYDTYYRIYYTIALCNEFIRYSSDDALAKFSEDEQVELRKMKAEARFLRSLAYSHALDLFREIDLGYDTLEPKFTRLFGADNHKCTNEILFAFAVDNEQSVSWGASTYIVCAQTSSLYGAEMGVGTQSWGMFRCRSQIPPLYETNDKRNLFYTTDRDPKITDVGDENVGYFYKKWNNLTDEGKAPAKTTDGVCTDLPIIRLADVYLMLAESYLRGATNITLTEALGYVNKVRERAFGNSTGNIQAVDLTLDFILDERARELSIEMVRRTDLVRFDRFTTDKYLWDFKGGQPDGTAVDSKYNIYPIPYAEQTANPNMKQDY